MVNDSSRAVRPGFLFLYYRKKHIICYANRKFMTFTQNIRSDIMSIEVDSDERTCDRFTEYPHLPADGSDRLLRPVYGQVGGDASV